MTDLYKIIVIIGIFLLGAFCGSLLFTASMYGQKYFKYALFWYGRGGKGKK